jgi:predicted aldo/keto reductase-like oxidoreductase
MSRQKKSSLLRLHLFNWALKSDGGIRLLQQAAKKNALSLLTWGFDPAVSIALRYALAEKLVSQVSTGYQLEAKGQFFLNQALKLEDAFSVEKEVLKEVSNSITEKMVEAIAKDWA